MALVEKKRSKASQANECLCFWHESFPSIAIAWVLRINHILDPAGLNGILKAKEAKVPSQGFVKPIALGTCNEAQPN